MRNILTVALLLVAVAASAQEAASKAPPCINHVILVGIYSERTSHELSLWISQKRGGVMIPVILGHGKTLWSVAKMPLGSLVFIEGELEWGYNKYGDKILKVRAIQLQGLLPRE